MLKLICIKGENMKKNTKEETRVIPTKNYYIVIVVSVLIIALSLYVRSFYLTYQANKEIDSVFSDKSINQINTEDFDFALAEANEIILYVSYSDSKEIKAMERKLYKEIEKKGLTDRIIYWNVNDLMQDEEYISILRNKYPDVAIDINKAPMIIYIKEGKAVEVLDSEEEMISYKTLNDLLIKYGIE